MNFKKELWLLLLAFVLPVLLGVGFFYLNPAYFKQNTINYGKLITPIITTNKADIVFNKNTAGSTDDIWTLAYLYNECNDVCKQTIKDTKTIKLLMNDKMKRLQRVFISPNTSNIAINKTDILLAKPSENLANKLGKFPQHTLFLIDPIGNIMLYYQAQDIDIKKVVKDLQRLFKYSRIG